MTTVVYPLDGFSTTPGGLTPFQVQRTASFVTGDFAAIGVGGVFRVVRTAVAPFSPPSFFRSNVGQIYPPPAPVS